jgi:ketosteroid isomerase-like protein
MDQAVTDFFKQYERANTASDASCISSLYADTFMFGGPNGVQALKKEDFLKAVPRMKAHFASLGLFGTQLRSVESSAISSKYLLAKAGWTMTLKNTTGDIKSVDAFATYVLERRDGDALTIILQIDHQDLAAVIMNQ